MSHINNLSYTFEKTLTKQEQEQADSRSEWRDNEDHVEINEIKIKNPIQLINEMCRQFLREIIKTDKPLAILTETAVLIK